MNKKANVFPIIALMLLLFLVLIAGLAVVFISGIANLAADEIIPEFTSIGVAAGTNISEVTGYTLNPINNLIQSFTWVAGLLYVVVLVLCISFAYAIRATANKWLIGVFLLMAISLVLASMFVANIYEDYYTDTGEYAEILREHTILSFLLLSSPVIMTVIVFISGILIFSGVQEEYV